MLGLDNPIHLAFILILLLLVFGAKRLPEMGRSLGAGLRGFKESISDDGPRSAIADQVPSSFAQHASTSEPSDRPAEPTRR